MSAVKNTRSGDGRDRSADQIRADALTCAVRLLTAGGADALSVRSLASALGTSTKVIYSHFGGMDQVLAGVHDHASRSLSETLERGDDEMGSRVERLWRVARGYRAFAKANPHLFTLLFRPRVLETMSAELLVEANPATIRLVCRIVAPPHASGAVTEATQQQARAFVATVHGPVSLEANGWLVPNADEVFDTVVSHAIRSVIAPPIRAGRV